MPRPTAILEGLQELSPFSRTEIRQAPIVEDEELNAPERLE